MSCAAPRYGRLPVPRLPAFGSVSATSDAFAPAPVANTIKVKLTFDLPIAPGKG